MVRKSQGMTQEDLSMKIGWGLSVIGTYERGEVAITLENLEKLANGLGVEVYELFIPSGMDQDYKEKVSEVRMKRLIEKICRESSSEQRRLFQLFLEVVGEML